MRAAGGGHQEVDIGALVGLCHGLQEEFAVAALRRRQRDGLVRHAPRQFFVADAQRDLALRDAQPDAVAAAHPRRRTAHSSLGRHMQHDGAEGGAAHEAIADARTSPITPSA